MRYAIKLSQGQRDVSQAHCILQALHSLRNVPLTWPEKRRRIERDDSDTSDSDGSSDASGSPASESEEDTSQTSICSAVFQMAMQGIKPAAPKLRRTVSGEGLSHLTVRCQTPEFMFSDCFVNSLSEKARRTTMIW